MSFAFWDEVDWEATDAEIAEKFGISRQAVYNKRRALGIPKAHRRDQSRFIIFQIRAPVEQADEIEQDLISLKQKHGLMEPPKNILNI